MRDARHTTRPAARDVAGAHLALALALHVTQVAPCAEEIVAAGEGAA